MPVYEPPSQSKTSPWTYIAYGCGGLILLVFIAGAAFSFFAAKMVRTAMTVRVPKPIPYAAPTSSNRTSRFQYQSYASRCQFALPDGSKCTYMHVIDRDWKCTESWDHRAISISTGKDDTYTLPLIIYFAASKPVKISVYWYLKDKSNFIRFEDGEREHLVDLNAKVSMMVVRSNGYAFGGAIADPTKIGYSIGGDSNGNYSGEIGGKPASDITTIISKDKGKYLGSIVQQANKLIWKPAK